MSEGLGAAEYDEEHETAFLRLQASAGVLTCVTHNEHNGYYGGFSVEVRAIKGGLS